MQYAAILCVAALVVAAASGAADSGAQGSKSVDLARAYRHAKTEKERRDLCIAMIDGGLIRRGVSIREIDELCGTAFSGRPLPKKGDTEVGVVHFAE